MEASLPNLVWQSDMTKLWAGPTVGWAYLVLRARLLYTSREIVGWDLEFALPQPGRSHRVASGHAPEFCLSILLGRV